MSNGFEELVDLYKDSVIDIDKLGYAETFKCLFNTISDNITKAGYTLKNVEFLDGYFLFGTGTNSIVHFEIKECKNWRFGIWFNFDENTKNVDDITFDIFAQHKDFLDKFKPSASSLIRKECMPSWDFEYLKLINFIAKCPLRAWYRDGHYVNYNYEYVSIFKLVASYIKYKTYILGMNMFNKTYDKIYLTYVKKNLLSLYDYDDEHKATIRDMGEYTSPRYDIVCEVPNDAETGWFELEDGAIHNCKKLRDFLYKHTPYHWFTPIGLSCLYYNKKEDDDEEA